MDACGERSSHKFDQQKKYVVSNSLESADWENSEIVSGDVGGKVADLKARDGDDITTSGSATTVRWLLREGLLSSETLGSGVLNLTYGPAKGSQGERPS